MTDKARDAMKGLVDVWSYIIDTDEATTENAIAWIRLCEAVQRSVDQEEGSASDGMTFPALCLQIRALSKADKRKSAEGT